jgi:hypothetical protein
MTMQDEPCNATCAARNICCPECVRTDGQHMADVAAASLATLIGLRESLDHLGHQLAMLADWADDHGLACLDRLDAAANAANCLLCGCLPEAIRDLASGLPIRGLDWNETASRHPGGRTPTREPK